MAAVRYPAAKVRIQVRFEDFKSTPVIPPALPPAGTGPEAFSLGIVHDIPIGTFKSVGFDIVPLSFTVERNSPRKADTAKVEILYAQLPFNPQILKAATIQVFAGMVSSEDFARACGPVGAQGLLLPDVVPQGWAFAGQSNEIFRGFIDDWSAKFDQNERIEIAARDTTGFLLDAECPENMLRRLPIETTLADAIKYLLFGDGLVYFGLPGMRGLEIVVESKRMPTLAEFKTPQWMTSKKKTVKVPKRAPKVARQKVWDMITDLCVSAGLKANIRPGRTPVNIPGIGLALPAAELVILDPATYYGSSLAPIRTFAKGRNVKRMEIHKQLGGVPIPYVQVRAWDSTAGKAIIGNFPPMPVQKKKANVATPSGDGDRPERKVFEIDDISGPKAQEIADAIAYSYYEQLARGEFSVDITTTLASGIPLQDNDETGADVLYMLPADPVRCIVDPAVPENGQISLSSEIAAMGVPELQAKIVGGGTVAPAIAYRAALATVDPSTQTDFYCQDVIVGWDAARGFEFQIKATNYLDARWSIDAITNGP
jgi:hypothetical protein